MQLTNIARDVGEDAAAGRLFLPLEWFDEAGLDAQAFLAAPAATPAVTAMVARLLGEAAALYRRGMAGLAALPLDCRTGIAAAGRIYAAIGGKVAAAGYDSITARARVNGREKLRLALRALGDTLAFAGMSDAAALPANAFLINAVAFEVPEPSGVVRLLEMFERLERSQREAAGQLTA